MTAIEIDIMGNDKKGAYLNSTMPIAKGISNLSTGSRDKMLGLPIIVK